MISQVTSDEALAVQPDDIPSELRKLRQWVCWRFEERDGRRTKVPCQSNGRQASSTDPTTWTHFTAATEAYRNGTFDGVGFVFTKGDPFVGIDLDKCRDPDTGVIQPWAAAIINRLQSYTEGSPSGTGVHVFIRGKIKGNRRRTGGIEVYDAARFFCVTGHRVENTPVIIEERQDAFDTLYAETFPVDEGVTVTTLAVPDPSSESDDDAVIERAKAAASGAKFAKLWAGDIAEYASASEADLSLCSMLARVCGMGRDDQVDRIFRRSGLYREKWERADYRKATIGKAVTGSFREAIQEHTIPQAGFHTELWAAERLVKEHGHDLRWCPTLGWLAWDGTRWRRDDTGEVVRRAKGTVRRLYADAATIDDPEKRKKYIDFVRGCESSKRLTAIVELARTQPGVPITADRLDLDPWLFNCKNGTIDLQSGVFREHRRGDFITKLAPVAFDPHAESRVWIRFLTDIFAGDEAMVRFVQRATGHAITGVLRDEVLHVLWGTGANGKTTFVETIAGMMGEYAMPAAPGLLLNRKNEQHPTERADLWGKRFVSAIEVGEGRSFHEELVKQLTGRDTIKGRFMHKDFFSFPPTHKLFVAANHKPEVYGTDYAIWRRVKLWPFAVTFHDPSEGIGPLKDITLPERLGTEWPGILNWCVEGCLAWQREGLAAPDCVLAATKAYREESDTIGRFIDECCEVGDSKDVRGGALYWAYTAWCEDNGHKPLSNVNFSKRLLDRDGIERDGTTGFRVYRGLWLTEAMNHRFQSHLQHRDRKLAYGD